MSDRYNIREPRRCAHCGEYYFARRSAAISRFCKDSACVSDRRRKYFLSFNEKRKAAGICIRCNRKKEPGRAKVWLCGECAGRTSASHKKRRQGRVGGGLCPGCESPFVADAGGVLYCAGCRAYNAERRRFICPTSEVRAGVGE